MTSSSDKWEALKAWLETERAAAGKASSDAAAAEMALVGSLPSPDWEAAVKAGREANSRARALAEVAQKMRELERGESRPRLRDMEDGDG